MNRTSGPCQISPVIAVTPIIVMLYINQAMPRRNQACRAQKMESRVRMTFDIDRPRHQ